MTLKHARGVLKLGDVAAKHQLVRIVEVALDDAQGRFAAVSTTSAKHHDEPAPPQYHHGDEGRPRVEAVQHFTLAALSRLPTNTPRDVEQLLRCDGCQTSERVQVLSRAFVGDAVAAVSAAEDFQNVLFVLAHLRRRTLHTQKSHMPPVLSAQSDDAECDRVRQTRRITNFPRRCRPGCRR